MDKEFTYMTGISLCMIVKNEEGSIERCLRSVRGVVDEIIVVDGYSKDRTVEICRKYTHKIFRHKWSGSFSAERNYSLSKATGKWILVLDGDEALSEGLRAELSAPRKDNADGYWIPRLKIFDGQPLKHGKAYPDCQLRLFRRGKGLYTGKVHERVVVNGKVGRFSHGRDILHYVTFDLKEFRKVLRFARMHRRTTRITHLLMDMVSIIWGFLFKGGFRDGKKGMIYHTYIMMYTLAVIYYIIRSRLSS
jgi:glycosyltransferase involved in cell wall biosynthesis